MDSIVGIQKRQETKQNAFDQGHARTPLMKPLKNILADEEVDSIPHRVTETRSVNLVNNGFSISFGVLKPTEIRSVEVVCSKNS